MHRCLRKSLIKGRLRIRTEGSGLAAYQERTCLKYFYDVRGSVAGTIRQENISEEAETQAESGGQDVLAGYLGKSSYRYTPFGELVCTEGENVGERFLYNAEAYDAVRF